MLFILISSGVLNIVLLWFVDTLQTRLATTAITARGHAWRDFETMIIHRAEKCYTKQTSDEIICNLLQ